jgi:hypothetical protein
MPKPAYRLLWLQGPPRRCPETGAAALYQDAILQLYFEEQAAALRLSLGVCADDQTYLAELPLLEEVLAEADYTPADVLGFAVDGQPVQTEVWLGTSLGAIPWDMYAAGAAAGSEWHETPLPTTQELRVLPQVQEAWMLAQAAGGYYLDERGQPTVSHVALLTTQDSRVRSVTLGNQPAGQDELRELIAKGCAAPPNDLPAVRPKVVVTDDPFIAEQLTEVLQDLGIRVEAGDVSPALEALSALKEALEPEPIPAYFSTYAESEVKAFFKAASAFFQTRPWEVIDGTRFLAFRLGSGPWHYANVMGQAGETFGLAMFGDWLEVCRALNNPETLMETFENMSLGAEAQPKSFLATGQAESMSLSPLQALAPEDAAFLKQLKIKPSWRKQYAAVHRYTPQGTEAPTFDPSAYTGLMTILAERAQKVRGNQISSIKAKTPTPQGELDVRYPAKGDENSRQEGYYRFQVPFHLGTMSATPGKVLWAELEAPGEAKWHRVMAALTKAAKTRPEVLPWPAKLKHGDYLVWLDQAPVKEPSPTVEQLAQLEGLTLDGFGYEDPLVFAAQPRPATAKVCVKFLEEGA